MDKQWTFSKATIEGPSSKFDAGYVQVHNMLVQTSLAEINGTFHVNGSLTLDTIDACVGLFVLFLPGRKAEAIIWLVPSMQISRWRTIGGTTPLHTLLWTPEMGMCTASYFRALINNDCSGIEADIHLHGPRSLHHQYPTFMASMRTFNAELNASITHDESTSPSEFHLRAMNYLAKTYITLDPKYEGTFELQTKLAKASVKEGGKNPAADPLGDGRKRGYQFDHLSPSQIFGWVGWGSRPGPTTRQNHQGHVEIGSSHSAVILQLDGAGTKISGQS